VDWCTTKGVKCRIHSSGLVSLSNAAALSNCVSTSADFADGGGGGDDASAESVELMEEKLEEQKFISESMLKELKGVQDKLSEMRDDLTVLRQEKLQLVSQISLGRNEKESAICG